MTDIRKKIIKDANDLLDSYHSFEEDCRKDDPEDCTHIILDEDDHIVLERGKKPAEFGKDIPQNPFEWLEWLDPR